MTRLIQSLIEIEAEFDAAVLDQYGVLHNGAAPYDGAARAMRWLVNSGKSAAVLSNSGKRAALNRRRIKRIGIDLDPSVLVETSGETAWREFADGAAPLETPIRLFPLEAHPGDAASWAEGNSNVRITGSLAEASALLLMGMPPGGTAGGAQSLLDDALNSGLPLICTNPDRASPDGDRQVLSPGVLADQYEERGGQVIWYGKPHRAVFDSVKRRFPQFPARRLLMIGDSLLHDIAGGSGAGFSTCFIRGGIHASNFTDSKGDDGILSAIDRICSNAGLPAPDYSLAILK